jgi:hypothetical protein
VSELHQAALAYCRHGWSVIPVAVAGKRALVPWKPWQQMPPGPDQLATWWQRWPAANLAVITGRVSGLVVIDIDLRHRGHGALTELETTHGDLPWSAVVETPSGGWHVYVAHPGGRVANSASRIGLGVDIRGDGGLALLPPSRGENSAYRWAVGGPATVPDIPAAWVTLLRPAPRPRRPAPTVGQELGGPRDARRLTGVLRVLGEAPEGTRNHVLFWAGCRLRELLDNGAPETWVETLIDAGIAAGLGRAECRDTVASALGRSDP